MTIEELIDEKTKLEKLVIQLAGENQQLKDKLSAKKASDTPFADLLETWLHNKKMSVKANTYEAYCTQVNTTLCRIFATRVQCFLSSRQQCLKNIISQSFNQAYQAQPSGNIIQTSRWH